MARKPDDKFKDVSPITLAQQKKFVEDVKPVHGGGDRHIPLDDTASVATEKPWWQTDIIPESADPLMQRHPQLLYDAALRGGADPNAWYFNDIISDGTETNPVDNGPYVNATPEPDIGPLDELSEDDREALSTALTKWNGITIDPVDPTTGNGGKDPEDKGGNGGDGGLGGIGIPDPVSYSSQYRAQMDAILRDLNLDKFKFDLNGEELYQQYKDQFLRNGRLAMMDTMGQAAGLTGGYGSTYSQNAGQQAYQGYVNDLNNVVPDVYNAAYTRWRDSISDKLRQYELLANQDNTDYSRWYNEQTLAEQQRKNTLAAQVDQYNAETKRQEADRKAADDEWDRAIDAGVGEYGPNLERIVNSNYTKNADGTYTRKTPVETPEAPKSTTKIGGVLESDITDAVTAHYENFIKGKGFNQTMAPIIPGTVAKWLAHEVAKKNNWGAATEDAAREMFEILLSNDKQ